LDVRGPGYKMAVAPQPLKVHVVEYRCECCMQAVSRAMTERSDGLCPTCGGPMLIREVFVDRRARTRPIALERRAA
jgi:hypothetical protein